MRTRICTCCGTEYPATLEHFYADKSVKCDGLASKCKVCRRKQMDKYKDENKEEVNRRIKDWAMRNSVKIATKRKEYKRNNRERIRIVNQEYYQRNKEHCLNIAKVYRENNPEKVSQRHKLYYSNNRHKLKETADAYLKTDHGRNLKNLASQRRRNRIRQAEVAFGLEEWTAVCNHFDDKCAYCGKSKKLTIEHFVPLSDGGEYTVNNILPVCDRCNKSKNNRDFFSWYPAQTFYDKGRERKVLKYLNYKGTKQQLALFK